MHLSIDPLTSERKRHGVDTHLDTSYVISMKKVTALQLRQSLSKVLSGLEKTGEPILLQRGQRPVGVIISLKDFRERFVEKAASEERHRIFEEMDRLVRKPADLTPAIEILRELRDRGY